jgi:hypothetical protein
MPIETPQICPLIAVLVKVNNAHMNNKRKRKKKGISIKKKRE